MTEISIHAIDVTRAAAAAGMRVVLSRVTNPAATIVETTLDESGACAVKVAAPSAAVYQIEFHIADFYRDNGFDLPDPPFLDIAPFRFGIADDVDHYHLPLKFTPWGFSLFRGG